MTKIYLNFICFIILFTQSCSGQTWEQIGKDITGEKDLNRIGNSIDINNQGNKIIVGYSNSFNLPKVKVYELKNSDWEQIGDTIKEVERESGFGDRVAINGDGNIIGVSAFNSNVNGNESGNAKIYNFENGKWNEILNLYGSNKGDRVGIKIESNKKGNIFVIAQQNNINCPENYVCGLINVYEKSGSKWVQKGNSIEPKNNSSVGQYFALDSAGLTLAFVSHDNSDKGPLIYIDVFKFINQTWVKNGKSLTIKNNGLGNSAEISISGNGKYLVVGLPNFDPNGKVVSGQVKVFQITGKGCIQIGQELNGENKFDYFGEYVDIDDSGKIIAIGTLNKTNGYIKIFKQETGKWIQIGQKLNGNSVKLSGNGKVVLTGNINDNNERGIIKVYKLK